MARMIRIQVQADRLPDVTSGDVFMVGLRVSAAIDPDVADPTKEADVDRILPWKWKKTADGTDWTPHDKTAWEVYHVHADGTTVDLIDPANLEFLNPDLSDFNPTNRFRDRIKDEVADILKLGTRTLEVPAQDGVISGRTVFGLVESLTSLPHPVPAAMDVWTAVRFAKASLTGYTDDSRFVGAPVFQEGDTKYDPDKPAPDGTLFKAKFVQSGTASLDANVHIHPTLKVGDLVVGNNPERLIDLAHLTIRARDKKGFEIGDWTGTVGIRLAEAIDPAARAMAVLDATIDRIVSDEAKKNETTTRDALIKDMTSPGKTAPPDYFRAFLRELHRPIVAPRARRSAAAVAPAAAFLEVIASRMPQLWPDIAPLLFAQAGAEGEQPPAEPKPTFQATSCARILGAAGVPPTPERLNVDQREDSKLPALDIDAELVDWLLRHWTTLPSTSVSDTHVFEETSRRFKRGDSNNKTMVEFDRVGIVDFSRLDPATTPKVVKIPVLFEKEAATSVATVLWHTPGVKRAGTVLKIELNFEAGKTTLEINGDAFGGNFPPLTTAHLTFEVDPNNLKVVTVRYEPAEGGLHEKEVDYAYAGRVGIAITKTAPVKTKIDFTPLPPPVDRDRLVPQAQAFRAALGWAYGSSIVPELLKGWAAVDGEKVPNPQNEEELATRVATVSKEHIEGTFGQAFDAAVAHISLPVEPDLLKLFQQITKLFEEIRKDAIEDAKRLARSVVPPKLEEADPITQDALPLSFLLSQLQDFNDKDDLWGRLAGVGVLISREPDVANDEWWSLNPATLHVTTIVNGARQPFTKDTAVQTTKPLGGTDEWKLASKVDPVPLSVGEAGGVQTVLIKYENHSIAAEMESAPEVDPAGKKAGPRRPEGYFFPSKNFVRMPALTFGRTYAILPYLVGHGGALPLALRKTKTDPVTRIEAGNEKFKINAGDLPSPGANHMLIRKTPYPRTVPVGAPRIVESQWPGVFPGVDALADELPIRPAPLTLPKDTTVRFFVERDRSSGLLSGREAALRIEIGDIQPDDAAATSLLLQIDGLDKEGAKVTLAAAEVALSAVVAAGGTGVRFDLATNEKPKAFALQRREHEHADDQPDATKEIALLNAPGPLGEIEKWDSAWLEVKANGGKLDFEPPAIRWAAIDPATKALVLTGDRQIFPPELAHTARKVAILDGIKTGAKTGPSTVKLQLRRPAVPHATYERWMNGPTGGMGNQTPLFVEMIGKQMDAGRARAAATGTGDRSFDDPAVEAIFVELVQLFPTRAARKIATDSGPVLVRRLKNTAETLEFAFANLATIEAAVGPDLLPINDNDGEHKLDTNKGALQLKLAPGGIYELRIYGGVPPEQKDLFGTQASPVAPLARFSNAVRRTFRQVKANAETWHLGTPLTLTFEVATDVMPECWLHAGRDGFDFAKPAFALDIARPPAVMEERALVRLVPEHLGAPIVDRAIRTDLEYASRRYVNRAALLTQRWSWRGRPHPEVVDATPHFGTKGALISRGLGEFVDAAFLGRADDDIGTVREVSFSRGHAIGQLPVVSPSTDGHRPVLMEHDLDRRAGVHLWRFALRLKSRYAPMRPNHPDLLRFSHQLRGSSTTHWWNVVVPDRVDPRRSRRAIDRPSLMLVLPLTEPLMTEGSVPPLLAVFNQELFPQFNAADGIEAVIDVARHPYPGIERAHSTQKLPDGSKTYRDALKEAWGEVAKLRGKLDDAEQELARVMAIGSTASKNDQKTAKDLRDDDAKLLVGAEEKFKTLQVRSDAWGIVERLEKVLADLEAKIATATGPLLIRLTRRRDEVKPEIEAATKHAKDLEATDPPLIAGMPTNPMTKYPQEISPDTMREATPQTDRTVAIRVDGPVGYTFDAGVDAGRFDHAAVLVSPVAEVVRPGSFVRLRFRRFEAPGLLVAPTKQPSGEQWPDEPPAKLDPELKDGRIPAAGAWFLIASGAGKTDDTIHRFHTEYEGLTFDVDDLEDNGAVQVRFLFVPADQDEPCNDKQGTTIEARVENSRVFVSAFVGDKVDDNRSAVWSSPISALAKVQLRLVVSLRPKPNGAEEYKPAGDVSVRVRITPDPTDPIRNRARDHAWLSVLCMPLNTPKTFTDLVGVRVCPLTGSLPVRVQPARLSEFTTGVWCQFASIMSRFDVDAVTNHPRGIRDVLPISAFTATLDVPKKTFKLGLNGLREGETLNELTIRTEAAPDSAAQIEEPIYAVVTRFVYDAFDRLRERVIGIHTLVDKSTSLGPRIWPPVPIDQPDESKVREQYEATMSGRIRLLRVIRGKLRAKGGFESEVQEFPRSFFQRSEDDETLDTDPPDAAGMAMGISTPIEWGRVAT